MINPFLPDIAPASKDNEFGTRIARLSHAPSENAVVIREINLLVNNLSSVGRDDNKFSGLVSAIREDIDKFAANLSAEPISTEQQKMLLSNLASEILQIRWLLIGLGDLVKDYLMALRNLADKVRYAMIERDFAVVEARDPNLARYARDPAFGAGAYPDFSFQPPQSNNARAPSL